jgi:hypothetical protein
MLTAHISKVFGREMYFIETLFKVQRCAATIFSGFYIVRSAPTRRWQGLIDITSL